MGVGQCPLWVISRHLQCNGPCLLYPQKADMCVAARNVRFGYVCYGPKADIRAATCHIRVPPTATAKTDICPAMSALTVKQTLQSQFDNPAKTFCENSNRFTGPERIEPPTFGLGKTPTQVARY